MSRPGSSSRGARGSLSAATVVLIIAPFVLGFTDHTDVTVLYVDDDSAAAVYLTSDDADSIHATALHMKAGRLAFDRRALSRGRRWLSSRTNIGASFGPS